MVASLDVGTYNLVCCSRDKDGKIKNKREVNAFLTLPLENRFVFNMMKAAGVPLIEFPEENCAYALGEAAVNIAYTMPQIDLKRPMKDGCLNPQEKMAQQIMSLMIHGLLADTITQDNETVFFCVPANAINEATDADYHQKVLEAIFRDFNLDENGNPIGPRVKATAINEALALVYAELSNHAYTGLAVSAGAGQVNVCFAVYGVPVFKFSIVNSGDWIDKMAAKATGENPTFINKEKTKTDLMVNPDSLVQRAIHAQYEIMMEHTAKCIKDGLEKAGNKARTGSPINVVVAGGTSLPNGFDKKFGEILHKTKLNIDLGNIIRPQDPLYSVARGCLVAAENSQN